MREHFLVIRTFMYPGSGGGGANHKALSPSALGVGFNLPPDQLNTITPLCYWSEKNMLALYLMW